MQQLNLLTAGSVRVVDRSKGAETVRPRLGKRCERRECDSVLSATNGENGDELNGETDDEDMEDGEMGFNDGSAQVRNIRDSGQPTAKEHQEHMTTHRPYRSWCEYCVMGWGVSAPHRRSDAQVEGVPHVSMDYGFLGGKESKDRVSLVLVIRERRHKMTWAMLVSRKGTEFPWIAKRAWINLGTTESRSGARTSRQLKHWRERLHKPAKKGVRLCQRDRQWEKVSPTGSSSVRWGSLPARPGH